MSSSQKSNKKRHRYEFSGTDTSLVVSNASSRAGPTHSNAMGLFARGRNQDLKGTICDKTIFWASHFARYSIFIQFHHFLVVCLMGMLLTKKSRSASLAYSALPSFHSELELHWKYRTGAKKARFWYHKRIHLNFHLSISISAWWSHWFFSTPISPQYQ